MDGVDGMDGGGDDADSGAGDGVDGGRTDTRAKEGGRRTAPETSERDESRGGRRGEGRLANFHHLIYHLRTF